MNLWLISAVTLIPQFWWFLWYKLIECNCNLETAKKMVSIALIATACLFLEIILVYFMEDDKMVTVIVLSTMFFYMLQIGYVSIFFYEITVNKCKCNIFTYFGSVSSFVYMLITIIWFIYCLITTKKK